MDRLKGIFAALVTPYDKDGRVNYKVLQQYVDYQASKGLEGFYVCGSTAESFLLSHDERKKILEAVVEANGKRAAVVAHCGSIGTDLTIDLAKHAVKTGVDAISAVTPFYFNFKPADIVTYYCDMANETGAPVIVYNIPKMSGVTVTVEMMKEMRRNPGIVGLKFTSQDMYALEQIKTSDPDLIVYNGCDEMCLAGLSMGADGAIGSTYNVMGKLFMQIRDLARNSELPQALALQQKANVVLKSLLGTGKLFGCLKYIITLRGYDFGGCRRPFPVMNDEDRAVASRMNAFLLENGIDF